MPRGVFSHSSGVVHALRDVSLELQEGEVLALVGGSGCGKSTLAKIIAGLLRRDSGELEWNGAPMDGWSRLDRARHIQMIFQDPYASLNPKLSIETLLSEVSTRASLRRTAAELLDMVGLSPEAQRHYPFQFSGGQRQRIAIARALAMQPRLLIADEPLSALDVTTQVQILDLLRQLKTRAGLTLLFITHDLAVAAELADRVVVLQEGHVVEEGPTQRVLVTPQHPFTQALLDSVPRI